MQTGRVFSWRSEKGRGLEADVVLSRSAALVLGYQGEMGSGQRDHSVNAKLRWAF